MIQIDVSDADLNRIKRKLSTAPGGIGNPQIIGAALEAGGKTLKRIMAEYPPVSRRPQPFKTDKQRRYFFWAIRKNLIVVPYFRGQNLRSKDMQNKWVVRKITNGVVVANNVSYARLVHGWDKQTAYHKATGWRTDKEVMATERDRLVRDIGAAYHMAINAIWGKG